MCFLQPLLWAANSATHGHCLWQKASTVSKCIYDTKILNLYLIICIVILCHYKSIGICIPCHPNDFCSSYNLFLANLLNHTIIYLLHWSTLSSPHVFLGAAIALGHNWLLLLQWVCRSSFLVVAKVNYYFLLNVYCKIHTYAHKQTRCIYSYICTFYFYWNF